MLSPWSKGVVPSDPAKLPDYLNDRLSALENYISEEKQYTERLRIVHNTRTQVPSDFTTTSASLVDITGASVTFTPTQTCRAYVWFMADMSVSAANTLAQITFNIGGADSAIFASYNQQSANDRITVTYVGSSATNFQAGQPTTIKMRAKVAGGATLTVFGTNSVLVVLLVPATHRIPGTYQLP